MNHDPQHKTKAKQSLFRAGLAVLVAAVVIGLATFWVMRRERGNAASTAGPAVTPTVAVVKVSRKNLSKQVEYTAEFRPYVEVELHAKVSGYVSQISVDFGDKVKAGQLLATLEVPELADEMQRAIAVELKAEADYTNAHLIYTRLQAVNLQHPNLVAQQDIDTAEANELSTAAAIAAAKAEVGKYRTLSGYTNIWAPFDGIVTHRYADPGTLIQAGTSSDTQARPLVRVSDNYHLRLDFPVTVDYVKDVKVGDPVTVRVDSLNGKTLTGKISRFTYDVNDTTRKMITEVEVPNPDLEIKPGMYAKLRLTVEKRPGALAIPIQAVNMGDTPTVMVVNHDNQIEQRTVKLGLETPDEYEVLSGLKEGDLVVIGKRGALQAGETVEPQIQTLPKTNAP
jgi:RND family efflux transporter MFP subunit